MQGRPVKKVKKSLWIPALVILIAALAAVVFLAIQKRGIRNNNAGDWGDFSGNEHAEKWQEGRVTYNGKEYEYNFKMKAYLIMGIDKEGKVEVNEQAGVGGGRSDAMFLLVVNPETKKMSVISINRNTMTRVEVFSEEGKSLGEQELQICLQHTYGDGGKISCSRSVDAVSYLFYNIPISGYLSLNMDGIPAMNDAIGGVKLNVLEDVSSGGVELKKGETKVLNGNEAYAYLRGRDINTFDSASDRLRRQEQYIDEMFRQLKEKGNSARSAMTIYNAIKDYLVTDMNAESLIGELMSYEYSADDLYTIPGETVMGEELEEFHLDNDGFYGMIIDLFYKEV